MKYLLDGASTERLDFRLLKESDFDEWLPLFSKPEVGTFLAMEPSLNQHQRCEKWFEKAMKRYQESTGGMNVLIHKETGKIIGQSGLLVQDLDGKQYLEVGYSILPEYWNQGYASEAAIYCKNAGFKMDYDKDYDNALVSVIHKDNIGSQKVAINNGMSVYRNLSDYDTKPFTMYRQTREQWKKSVK